MPKDTFVNLPEDKRIHIMGVAIDEFFEYGYEKSSISRICELSGIAKGSFYQYFDNKEDLFRYIMELAAEKKLAYLNDLLLKLSEMNFFETLRELFMGSLIFQKENPKLAGITDRFLKNANSKFKELIMGDNIKGSNLFIENLLIKGISGNEVRHDLNISFISRLVTGVAVSLSDHMRERFEDIEKLDEDMYRNLVDESIKFLEEGIKL